MVASKGMCRGVTPSGPPGSTRPSMRSATAWAITFAAKISVPAGRWGPCCSTLPCGRITTGFFFICAAISGCVRSMKYRLGNMDALASEARARMLKHLGDAHRLSVSFDGAQRRVHDGDGHIAVVGTQLVRLAGPAALRKQLELGAEHVAWGNV